MEQPSTMSFTFRGTIPARVGRVLRLGSLRHPGIQAPSAKTSSPPPTSSDPLNQRARVSLGRNTCARWNDARYIIGDRIRVCVLLFLVNSSDLSCKPIPVLHNRVCCGQIGNICILHRLIPPPPRTLSYTTSKWLPPPRPRSRTSMEHG